MGYSARSALAALCILGGVAPAVAQSTWVSGYLQTVPLFSGATQFSQNSFSDFNRIRLTIDPSWGPLSVETAYDNTVSFRQRAGSSGFGLDTVPRGGEWLPLGGTLTGSNREHVLWSHRLDRLNIGFSPTDAVDLTVGRQAVSWGTTLFLTPADPFLPFSPADPFRQFRGGVDAARLRLYPGPLSALDLVVRVTDTPMGQEVTALGRGLTTWRNWELSAWAGTLYGDAAGAVGATGGIGPWAVRVEAVIRAIGGRIIGRGTVGLDRNIQVGGRDLYLVLEYQRDGLAASEPDEYLALLLTSEFLRGELQTLGRDEAVAQAAYQFHPLWSLSGLAMWNMNDGSVLLAPGVGYSAGDETTISGGIYFGHGADTVTATRPLPSEFGLSGTTGYLSVSFFF